MTNHLLLSVLYPHEWTYRVLKFFCQIENEQRQTNKNTDTDNGIVVTKEKGWGEVVKGNVTSHISWINHFWVI